jgi:hypothetical protein
MERHRHRYSVTTITETSMSRGVSAHLVYHLMVSWWKLSKALTIRFPGQPVFTPEFKSTAKPCSSYVQGIYRQPLATRP